MGSANSTTELMRLTYKIVRELAFVIEASGFYEIETVKIEPALQNEKLFNVKICNRFLFSFNYSNNKVSCVGAVGQR